MVSLKKANSWDPYHKNKFSAKTVVEELKEKMSRLKFRLLDCQNQNQMLRKELLLAKKVIKTEVTNALDDNFQDLQNLTDFRGRQEKILILKNRLNELQNRIKELEDGITEKPTENSAKSSKVDKQEEYKMFQNKKTMDKELEYLLENSCRLKRKLEVWKKRSAELNKEAGLLHLELDRLLEKSKEDKAIHDSYHVLDKELRARQAEKLEMRSKLDFEKTRNAQLSEELAALKEDLSMILSKVKDDKVLIATLKNQQGCLIDLLERQKLISEKDSQKFQDDMREIQEKHATNNHVLEHLQDIVEDKTKFCQYVQESIMDEQLLTVSVNFFDNESEKQGISSTSMTTDSELTSQSESQKPPSVSADEPSPDNETASADNEEASAKVEIIKLKEEAEKHKNIFQSFNDEMEQLSNIVSSNNNKLNEWMTQLFQTNSLLAQKNAEIRELEETAKKLSKLPPLPRKESAPPQEECTSQDSNSAEEMQKKHDILQEEHQFLLAVWDLLISNKENSLEVLFVSTELRRKQFINAIPNLISEEDLSSVYEESFQSEEQSEP